MVYKAIGLMSGSSLDGLDVAYVHLQETAGKWSFEILHADCYAYPPEWQQQLEKATALTALDYQLLHTAYGHYTGELVNAFISTYDLEHKVDLIASHGHTTFHVPSKRMTAQLGDGAAIAAVTGLPVVSDLRALDLAFGGQGAPIVPIGEKLLLSEFDCLLNLGGIANLSVKSSGIYVAFDVCAANRVMNMLAGLKGKSYDENGAIAASGEVQPQLLNELNALPYYALPYPKSLANDFGTGVVYPLIQKHALAVEDALSTYVAHICIQIKKPLDTFNGVTTAEAPLRMLVTGGGAFNDFLIKCLGDTLQSINVALVVPENKLISYKEAMVMALIGVLRWREEYNVLASVTGATRNSIGGALWMGAEA